MFGSQYTTEQKEPSPEICLPKEKGSVWQVISNQEEKLGMALLLRPVDRILFNSYPSEWSALILASV